MVGFDAHDDAFGVHLVNDAIAPADHHRAGIARGHALHTSAHERGFAANQRYGLALHIRAHQRAVRIVVLEEGNQAGGHGDQLLGRHIDVIHFFALFQHEVSSLPAVHQFGGDPPAIIEGGVSLGDDVAVLLPG